MRTTTVDKMSMVAHCEHMPNFSAKDAKNHFGQMIDAARLEPVVIEKRGRPMVVVCSVEEFERLSKAAASRARPTGNVIDEHGAGEGPHLPYRSSGSFAVDHRRRASLVRFGDPTSIPNTVGMTEIKDRRLRSHLTSHPDLTVGSCVPFYFCPRSVMLYLLHKGNREGVTYRGGQQQIVHLVADVPRTVAWANGAGLRWAFTLSNAGSGYFRSRSDLAHLSEINWNAVNADTWSGIGVSRDIKEGKQAEFLVEERSLGIC